METTTHTFPSLDLTKDPKTLERGSLEWKKMCLSIREDLEKHGGFLVNYDKITGDLVDKMFSAMPDLFALPVETKCKNAGNNPYLTYTEKFTQSPVYEALGVHDAEFIEEARAFNQLMWADGNNDYCQIMHMMTSNLLELIQTVAKMVCDSYNAGMYCELEVEKMGTLFQMTKYSAPYTKKPVTGDQNNTDDSFLTVLFQDDINGLQFQTREGDWFAVNPSRRSFVISVGYGLQAWSNGRIFAIPHRVMLIGNKDQFTCALFFKPKRDYIMKAASELTVNEQLPLITPFNYEENCENVMLNDPVEVCEDYEKYREIVMLNDPENIMLNVSVGVSEDYEEYRENVMLNNPIEVPEDIEKKKALI